MVNAYYPILGVPLIVLVGVLTFTSLVAAITSGVMIRKGIHIVSYPWHMRLAYLTVALASFHAFLALS
jgi:hypothetical protein